MYNTIRMAEFVHAAAPMPVSTYQAASRVLFDTLGVAAAGSLTPSGRAACNAAISSWGEGKSTVWFSKQRLTTAGAAFVNAAYASSLDLDDGHRLASGHPASSIVPAVLAIAEELPVSLAQILTATVLGYEIGVRVAASRDINGLRTVDTGRWCGYGVAAAMAWLHGASVETMAHAMAIAGHTASTQTATGFTKLGHSVKEGIPIATALGIISYRLAASGYTGPLDILDDRSRFDSEFLLDGLGEKWMIDSGYFKLYSACRWAHAPIDGAMYLQRQYNLDVRDIETIDVGLFSRALTLTNLYEPASIEEAQYSIPYCVALALCKGADALLPITDESLHDAQVLNLTQKVKLRKDKTLEPAFPAATPAIVSIRLHDGRAFSTSVPSPKGEPKTPVTNRELETKFRKLAGDILSESEIEYLSKISFGESDESSSARLFRCVGIDSSREEEQQRKSDAGAERNNRADNRYTIAG